MRVSATSAAPVISPPLASADRSLAISLERVMTWLPWLAGALTLVAAVHAIEPLPVGVFYDDAQYVVLARSLATGHGYRFLNLPGVPAATHFPPGYPVFLALLWRIAPGFPENVALFKFANALLLALVAVLVCRLGQRTLSMPRPLAAIAALAGAATIPSLVLSSALMSEPLFLALLLPLLVWSERAAQATEAIPLWQMVLLGAAAGGLALVRSHGIALAAAVCMTLLMRRSRREALVFAAATFATLAPWLLWVQLHDEALPSLVRGAYGSYTAWLVDGWRAYGMQLLAVTIPDNVATMWMTIVRSIVPSIRPLVDGLVGSVYFLLAAVGVARCWRAARVTVLFVTFYVAIVLVWPFSPLRFFWGIWPLLMLLPAVGLHAAWTARYVRQRPPIRVALVAGAVLLAAGIASFNVLGYANAWWSSNARFHARRVLPELAWVARATRPDDVVAADAEAAVYLYTGRRAVPITTFTAAEYVRERTPAEEVQVVDQLLRQYRPRYVVGTSPQIAAALARLAREVPTRLVLVDSIAPSGVAYAFRTCTVLAGREAPRHCE